MFNVSLQGADELGGYALAVGSTIAFSLALMGRNHIRVDVFHEKFPRALQACAELAVDRRRWPCSAIFIAWVAFKVIGDTMQYGSTAQTPWATPLIWPQGVWYAGLVIFALVAIGYAVRATLLLFTRPHRHAEPRLPSEERQGRAEGRARRPGACARSAPKEQSHERRC